MFKYANSAECAVELKLVQFCGRFYLFRECCDESGKTWDKLRKVKKVLSFL